MKRKFNNTMSYYRLQIFVLILQYLKNKALVKCNTAVGIKGKQAKGKKVKGKEDNKYTIYSQDQNPRSLGYQQDYLLYHYAM